MHSLKNLLAILLTAVSVHATRTLLPPSAIHSIEPAARCLHSVELTSV